VEVKIYEKVGRVVFVRGVWFYACLLQYVYYKSFCELGLSCSRM